MRFVKVPRVDEERLCETEPTFVPERLLTYRVHAGKHRLVDERSARLVSARALRARLDDEDIALEPRRTTGLAPVNRGYTVRRIVHLTRHAGGGVDRSVLSRSDASRLILDQLRGEAPFPTVGAATRLLGRLQNVRTA